MNNGRWIVGLACLLGVSSLSGCATVLSKKQYDVTMDNAGGPTYFSVADRNQNVLHEGVTPQQVSLDAKAFPFWPAKYHVTFAGSQSNSELKTVKAGMDAWMLGNLVLGGVPGFLVDGATGAAFKLPSRVQGSVQQQFAVADSKQGALIATNHRTQKSATTQAPIVLAKQSAKPIIQTASAKQPSAVAPTPREATPTEPIQQVQLAAEPKKGFWPFR